MTKVVLGMSMSLDGIAGGESADADGFAIHEAILGWQFPLRSWRGNPPFHAPVFVLTHRGQARIGKSGGTSYTFVTEGIKAAVEQARAVAGGKDVLLAGGVSIAQQALAAGLVDEIRLHVAPVLIGRGLSLFGPGQADLRCAEAIPGEGAVHLRYEIR